jgi:glucokinase
MGNIVSSNQSDFIIGVDIGGTKVAAGLVDAKGKIHQQIRVPMVVNNRGDAGLAAVTQAIDQMRSHVMVGRLRGIGICAPGPLDPSTGVILNPPNVPCWRDFPLAEMVSDRYEVAVKVDNDANAAALAEALWGAGRGYRNIFYATLGTGVGTGLIFDGEIYHGRTGAAAEGGHVSIDYRGLICGCGKPGCIEAYASGPAIAKRAQTLLNTSHRDSVLTSLAKGGTVTTQMVAEASAQGDPIASEILDETVHLLSMWLGSMIDLLEPDVIIVGGGVAAMMKPFFADIVAQLPQCCLNRRCQEIPLVMAHYGTDAGIAGGAALVSDRASSESGASLTRPANS